MRIEQRSQVGYSEDEQQDIISNLSRASANFNVADPFPLLLTGLTDDLFSRPNSSLHL